MKSITLTLRDLALIFVALTDAKHRLYNDIRELDPESEDTPLWTKLWSDKLIQVKELSKFFSGLRGEIHNVELSTNLMKRLNAEVAIYCCMLDARIENGASDMVGVYEQYLDLADKLHDSMYKTA